MVACLIHEYASAALDEAERRLKAAMDENLDCVEVLLRKRVLDATEEFFRASPRAGEPLH